MDCNEASSWFLPRRTGIHQTTAVSRQIIQVKSQATTLSSTASNKSCGRCIVFKTLMVQSLPPHSTRAASLMFFTRGSSETLIVTALFLTTLIDDTPVLLIT